MIMGDQSDLRRTILYTVALLVGVSAVLVGNLYLDTHVKF